MVLNTDATFQMMHIETQFTLRKFYTQTQSSASASLKT